MENETVNHEPIAGDKIESFGYEEFGTPEQITAMYMAMAAAQAQIRRIERTKQVRISGQKGSYTFEYAEMDELNDACRDAFSTNGIGCFTPFSRQSLQGEAIQHLIVSHRDGGRARITFAFAPGHDVKDLGGQTTYIMRYLFSKFWRLHAEGDADDQPTREGETSAEVTRKREEPRREPPKPVARPATPPVQQAPKAAPAAPKPADPAPAPAVAVKPETPPEKPASVPPAAPATVDNGEKPNQATRTELHRLCLKIGLKSLEAENFCREVTGLPSGKLTQAGAEKLVAALREKAGE